MRASRERRLSRPRRRVEPRARGDGPGGANIKHQEENESIGAKPVVLKGANADGSDVTDYPLT